MSAIVARLGPFGIFLLMVPESACVPLPSEVTLLSAGFGVHQGWFSFPAATAAATAGNLVGSLIAYWLGRRGMLTKVPRRGRGAVARCERLFGRLGDGAVFTARLLPLARTFVSLPAGHARVPFLRFVVLTVAGCAIWSAGLVLAGLLAGASWHAAATAIGRGSAAIAVAIALLALGARPVWRAHAPRETGYPRVDLRSRLGLGSGRAPEPARGALRDEADAAPIAAGDDAERRVRCARDRPGRDSGAASG